MKLLLDTHTFLWFVAGSTELSAVAKKAIENPQNENYVSIASLWEISIKTATGKLDINGSYETVIDDVVRNGILILPIDFQHTVQQNQLPFYHRDPFDRIIVSQAIVENMDVVSKDAAFDDYLQGRRVKRIF